MSNILKRSSPSSPDVFHVNLASNKVPLRLPIISALRRTMDFVSRVPGTPRSRWVSQAVTSAPFQSFQGPNDPTPPPISSYPIENKNVSLIISKSTPFSKGLTLYRSWKNRHFLPGFLPARSQRAASTETHQRNTASPGS